MSQSDHIKRYLQYIVSNSLPEQHQFLHLALRRQFEPYLKSEIHEIWIWIIEFLEIKHYLFKIRGRL